MKFVLPRKRVILAMHRWLGAVAAVFLVILSLTGLCLNHAERLGLHDFTVRVPFLLKQYNMLASSDIQTLKVDETNTLSYLGESLYFNEDYVAESGKLVAMHRGDQFLIVATERELIFLTYEGEFVESQGISRLPFNRLKKIGTDANGEAVIISDQGNWSTNPDWLEFEPYTGGYSIQPVIWTRLDSDTRQAILLHHQGKGPSLYRVLLDLHSGRLFGWGGRTVMDLTGLAILLLVGSGISGWLRKSRKHRVVN